MSDFNPKQHLISNVRRAQGLLANDLNAVAGEQRGASPGGCARPPLPLVAECAAVNGLAATAISGGGVPAAPPSMEERSQLVAAFPTAEAALAYLSKETDRLVAAIESLDDARLGETLSLFGRDMTLYGVADLAVGHMMYHDGQLNYIHTLHGDAEMHWGG